MKTFKTSVYFPHLIPVLLLLTVNFACSSSNMGVAPAETDDPSVIAVIGNETLTINEFEDRYARSVGSRETAAMDSMGAYVDFLDRYIDFRLKVRYARELGFESDSAIVSEIDSYRKQLARPYLLEKEIIDPILMDLYEKQQEMVDASHILLRLTPDATPDDTMAVYSRMEMIIDSLKQGEDFGDLAFRNSDDPSARSNRRGAKGRLGYFEAGQMVKPFEDAAYATPVDTVSTIFRTRFGYHVLFVHDRRASETPVSVSHIATRDLPGAENDSTTAEQRIQVIYDRLNSGESFEDLARTMSEDQQTRQRAGLLGNLTYTQQGLPESFRDALFALESPGDVSEIVQTNYGYHIIKLNDREPKKTFEERYDDLKAQANRLPRLQNAESEKALAVRQEKGFAIDTTLVLSILNGKAFNSSGINTLAADTMDLSIVTLGDSTYTFRQVVGFAETNPPAFNPDTLGMVMSTLDSFINEAALNYAAAQLEYTDDEFSRIMQEFKDGLLLFKLMEDSVWTAAAQDTAALMAYHEPRAESYQFPDRTRIISMRSRSDSLLTAYTDMLSSHALSEVLTVIEEDTTVVVRVDTTFIDVPNNSVFDKALNLEKGSYTKPEINAGSYLVMINDGFDLARQKTFEEARSEIVNIYQGILEEQLIERLRTKYGVSSDKDKLSGVFASEKHTTTSASPSGTESSTSSTLN